MARTFKDRHDLLDVYVAPRPKTYADRRWLEGYTETASFVREWHPRDVGFYSTMLLNAMIRGDLKTTHKNNGGIDAFLDSVGC